MEFSNQICKDTQGYNTFVLPEFQHACDSLEYEQAVKDAKLEKLYKPKGLQTLPCCNVKKEHDKKGKGSEHVLEEARKSFMSGHSSFSFYCATFLVIYLQVRLSNEQVKDSQLLKEGNLIARTIFRYPS